MQTKTSQQILFIQTLILEYFSKLNLISQGSKINWIVLIANVGFLLWSWWKKETNKVQMLNFKAYIAAVLIGGASDTGFETQDCRVLLPLALGNIYVTEESLAFRMQQNISEAFPLFPILNKP